MGPAVNNQATQGDRTSGVIAVMRFGLCVLVASLLLSAVASPWVDLPWWKVFRRCVSIAAALSVWLCTQVFDRRSLRSYGLGPLREGKRHLVLGLLVGLGAVGMMLAVGLVTGSCRVSISPDRIKLWRTILGFIPAAVLVGLLEELVFRGVILQHLARHSRGFAVAASSGLYALVHLKILSFGLQTWMELGGLFLLGGLLSFTYLWTQQLYLAIGLHASLAYGARVNKLLIEFPDTSRSWLVGTNRLVNGLAGWVALVGIGIAVMWWVRWAQNRGGARHGTA